MNSPPRIIGGQWRGRKLRAPAGDATRPTAARVRQAAFDILLHAPWGGHEFLQTARVLDVFAGIGAFGLEALSRGCAFASFIEIGKPALDAIKANVAACKVAAQANIVPADARKPPAGTPHQLVFLDPPYGEDLVPLALAALDRAGWIAPGAIAIAELGPRSEFIPDELLAERQHGQARLVFFKSR